MADNNQIDDWEDVEVDDWEDVDDWQDVDTTPQDVSKTESFLRGVGQGATLGYSDEMLGALRAGKQSLSDFDVSKFPERYRSMRDEERQKLERARRSNPATYMGGEIGGGVGTAFIPGMGAATFAKAAGLGAAAGLGTSSADLTRGEIGGAIKDTATGAALGGAIQGIGKGLSWAAQKPSKVAKTFLGLPEEAYEQYVKNPAAVRSALEKRGDLYGLPDISQKLASQIDDLAEQASSGSQAARKTLEFEQTKLPKQQLYDYLQQKLDFIKASEGRIPDEAYDKARQVLKSQQNKIEKLPDLTGTEVMDRVREMRRALDWNPQAGNIDTKSAAIIRAAQRDYDQALKSVSPAYRAMMAESAEAAKLLDKAKPLARSEQGALNFVSAVDRQGNKFRADVMRELDKKMGTNLTDEALAAIAARSIDRSAAQGSRSVNLGRGIGQGIGGLVGGRAGEIAGEAVGAIGGAATDTLGRRAAIGLIDTAAAIERRLQSGSFAPSITRLLKKAAEKGPQNLVLTFQLLSRDNPELAQSIGE